MPLSNMLKSLRAIEGLKQEDMASLLGISRNAYHKKEICERKFTLEEARAISDYFNKSIEDIFFTEQSNTKDAKITS
ncbi:MAG: helix-turn-helix domain-containing protein [Bacilli bacterium]